MGIISSHKQAVRADASAWDAVYSGIWGCHW